MTVSLFAILLTNHYFHAIIYIMSEVRFSDEGQNLANTDPNITAILPEFALEYDDIGDIQATKSYRGTILGSGDQAIVFAVKNTNVAEKAWRRHQSPRFPEVQPGETFDRNIVVRDYWRKEKPQGSKLYIPEYYAVAQHPSNRGAILMEKSEGFPADKIAAAATNPVAGESLAQRMGIKHEKLDKIVKELTALIRSEDEFYQNLFNVVPLTHPDPSPRNMLVDYDPIAGEITRLTAIDL
jgi:hypothetical protein